MDNDDIRSVIIDGATKRDHGKRFRVTEVDPLAASGLMLRLVAALRIESYDALLSDVQAALAEDKDVSLDLIMKVLAGCDPRAVHELVTEALEHVEIAPDPKHPGAFRPMLKTDIKDLPTLGSLLIAFVKLNFGN